MIQTNTRMDLKKIYGDSASIIYRYLQPYDIVKFSNDEKIKEMKLEYYKPVVNFITEINLLYYKYIFQRLIKTIINNYDYKWEYKEWKLQEFNKEKINKILKLADEEEYIKSYLSRTTEIEEKYIKNKKELVERLEIYNNKIGKIIEILFVNDVKLNKLIFNQILITRELLLKNDIKTIQIVNKCGRPNRDPRCTDDDKLEQHIMLKKFNPIYIFESNKDFTIYDLINGFFSIKTSKTDLWYELFCRLELQKSKDKLIITIDFDYGS